MRKGVGGGVGIGIARSKRRLTLSVHDMLRKMELNKPRRQKLERQRSWMQMSIKSNNACIL